MLEKIRIFISQFVTGILIAFLAIQIGRNIMDNTGFKNRLGNLDFNYESLESIAVALLLVHLAVFAMVLILWLIRWPKTNYTKKRRKTARKIDMGKVKNIPERVR